MTKPYYISRHTKTTTYCGSSICRLKQLNLGYLVRNFYFQVTLWHRNVFISAIHCQCLPTADLFLLFVVLFDCKLTMARNHQDTSLTLCPLPRHRHHGTHMLPITSDLWPICSAGSQGPDLECAHGAFSMAGMYFQCEIIPDAQASPLCLAYLTAL